MDNVLITNPNVELIAHTKEPEKVISAASKLCYSNSTPSELLNKLNNEQVTAFLNKIMTIGHESILEHATFTFAIENISRVTEIQLVRHRTGSPSIQSGRYVKRNPHFHIPKEIEKDDLTRRIYIDNCEYTTLNYLNLIDRLEHIHVSESLDISIEETYELSKKHNELYEKERKKVEKISLEDARYCLPQGLITHAIFTIDLRNLIHLISKRRCNRAQSEIRDVANQMYKLIKPLLPTISKYIGAPCEIGFCNEGYMSCGNPYKTQ